MKSEDIPVCVRDESFDEAKLERKIDSWSDFEKYYEEDFRHQRGRWYFRGQRDSNWPIDTTLARLLRQMGPPVNAAPYPRYPSGHEAKTVGTRVELMLLRAFQARASKFLPNLPNPDETLEWLVLMRHWGLPSRLLDVTTSPFVALYFALAEFLQADRPAQESTSPVVWAIHHVPLRGVSAERVGARAHTDLSEPSLFNSTFLSDPPTTLFAPVHPRSHNERLAAQQGTFLCVGNPGISLDENLSASVLVDDLRGKGVLRRLLINPKIGIEILARLSAMNINRATLFPDLQGYARFIEDSVRLFSKDPQKEPRVDFESLERLGWLG